MPVTSNPPAQATRTEMVRLLVTPAEKAELVALSQQRGVSVAEIIRTALSESVVSVVVTRDRDAA